MEFYKIIIKKIDTDPRILLKIVFLDEATYQFNSHANRHRLEILNEREITIH
jgi:hypothetical protein